MEHLQGKKYYVYVMCRDIGNKATLFIFPTKERLEIGLNSMFKQGIRRDDIHIVYGEGCSLSVEEVLIVKSINNEKGGDKNEECKIRNERREIDHLC